VARPEGKVDAENPLASAMAAAAQHVGLSIFQELQEGVAVGDVPLVRELLQKVEKEEEKVTWLREALLRAAYDNKSINVKTLLEAGAEPSATDELGLSPLHWAARQGHEDIARALVDGAADPSARTQDQSTPLHLAAASNAGPIVKMLLSCNVDPAAVTVDKRTALHMAADTGATVAAAVLLEGIHKDADGNKIPNPLMSLVNEKGETPLARAASRGHSTMAQLLLKKGAKTTQGNWWGHTPLQLAAFSGHVGAVAVMLDGQADVNAAAQDGSTALHSAAERGYSQVVELLLAHGAKHQATATMGRTPLHCAAERGAEEATAALIAHGAEVDARNQDERTPLALASQRGHTAVCRRLLESKADPQALDTLLQSTLHAAANAGRSECGILIIEKRARVEQQDAAGRTPLDLAISARQEGMVRVLLKEGADMPEEYKEAPEWQQLIREVEHEVLQEQMAQLEAGRDADKAMEAAEKEFEKNRINLNRLATEKPAKRSAPILHHMELVLHDAKEFVKGLRVSIKNLGHQLTITKETLGFKQKEAAERREKVKECKKNTADAKADKEKKELALTTINKEIADAEAAAREAHRREVELRGQVIEAQQEQEDISAQLGVVVKENEGEEAKLAALKAQLAKWHAEKDEASALHKKAQEYLTGARHGSSASETGVAAAAAVAADAALAPQAPKAAVN